MRFLKILLAIIAMLLVLTPIAMFIPLFFKSTLGWILFVKNLPEYTYYVVAVSAIVSQIYLLTGGINLMKRKQYLE